MGMGDDNHDDITGGRQCKLRLQDEFQNNLFYGMRPVSQKKTDKLKIKWIDQNRTLFFRITKLQIKRKNILLWTSLFSVKVGFAFLTMDKLRGKGKKNETNRETKGMKDQNEGTQLTSLQKHG